MSMFTDDKGKLQPLWASVFSLLLSAVAFFISGNIATEELVMLCDEMGIATGIDLEALIAAGRLAERIIGRQLPSAALRSGTLKAFRQKAA